MQQHREIADLIIENALRRWIDEDVTARQPHDALMICTGAMMNQLSALPEAVANEVSRRFPNGNGTALSPPKRLRDKAKAHAVPVGGGMGFMAVAEWVLRAFT